MPASTPRLSSGRMRMAASLVLIEAFCSMDASF
jgi:hypothetical protein